MLNSCPFKTTVYNNDAEPLLAEFGMLVMLEKEVNHEEEANCGSESGWCLSSDEPVLFG
jgi:hypothetical protein